MRCTSKMKYLPILLLLIILSLFINNSCIMAETSPIKQQWYLNNTGDTSAIKSSIDYKDYMTMKSGVDIKYSLLQSLLSAHSTTNRICIAILDTGVDFNHQALREKMWVPSGQVIKNFNGNYIIDSTSGKAIPKTDSIVNNPHGTMCAGIIVGNDNKNGFTGIASTRDVKIMSIDIMDNNPDTYEGNIEDLILAIKFAERNSAKICNISSSTYTYNKKLEHIMRKSKMLFVVSAGNRGGIGINIDKLPVYPAAFGLPNIISVANLSYNGDLYIHSNYGHDKVDLAAPGTCIYTTTANNGYDYYTGTSMAAPMVTATAAILFTYNKNLSAADVKNIIINTVDHRDSLFGKVKSGGSLNSYKAVDYLLNSN